ncbi:MAG: methyltransferase domain-containing protein [Oscillospiraceae bacterium]|nr:methyltransferase domain-containing protein [Oscillospiraceae bacterium]
MSISTEISDRFWNQPQKGAEEAAREKTFIDDVIQKSHIERLLRENLAGIRTVFDGGGGSGRFSVLLASLGLQVTHFDISQPMLDTSRARAETAGVADNITFVHGKLEDLSAFSDRQFDLVMSFDAPISYTYPNHESVIGSLVRIAAKKLIISVYSRLGWTPYLFNPAQKVQYILDKNTTDPFARWCLDQAGAHLADFLPDMAAVRRAFATGLSEPAEVTAAAYDAGEAPFPVSYTFMPDELQAILTRYGARNVRLSGPGALSRSIPNEVLVNIMRNEALKADFLDFCYEYDSQLWCAGMGKDNIAAVADI